MKLLKLSIVVTGLVILTTVTACGQYKISGTLTDTLTHAPIPFATATLLNDETGAAVKEIQTGTSGGFVFAGVPAGMFTLRVSYVGYNDIVRKNILINPSTGNVQIGTLLMSASNNSLLKEVIVNAAKKDLLQNIDGKKVFSVNQSLVSKGGNAAELLQNVPTLQIDANGNVSLRGGTRIKVLIDGKPSIIANGDIVQILQSIPASSIESIEVIANPPAKYDGDGEGIINIILKKNSRPGLKGSADIGIGTRKNYNGNASLGYQSGKVNVYGNYSLKGGNTYSNGYQYMNFLQPTGLIKYSNETFPSITSNTIQFVKAGVDYAITPRSTLGISGSFNSRNRHRDEVLTIDNLAADGAPVQSINCYNNINTNSNSYEVDIDYTQHFNKPKEELTFNFAYSHSNLKDYQAYETYFNSINGQPPPAIDTPLISDIKSNTTNYNIQADYVLPVGKQGEFTVGYRTQLTLGTNNQYAYNNAVTGKTPLYAFTSFFNSHSQVHAVYLNYKNQAGIFSYSIGVRGEYSRLNGTYKGYNTGNFLFTQPLKVPVTGLYPSALLTVKLKNNSRLQFTFANRLSKPSGREVNPTTDFSDPVNYYKGNPGVRPESINNIEVNYYKKWQHASLTSGIYYNNTNHIIQHIQTGPVGDVTYTLPENLDRSTILGLELIGQYTPVKGWNITANANMYRRHNDAAPQYGIAGNNGFSWNANITSSITPVQNLSFQIHADYRAPFMAVQDYYHAMFGLDAAARFDFWGNKASLTFNAINIFNSRTPAFLRSSDNLLLDWQRRTLSSRATLTFSWRFGTGIPGPHGKKDNEKVGE